MKAKHLAALTAAAVLSLTSAAAGFSADAADILWGDVDLDEQVGLLDVVVLQQYLDGKLELSEDMLERANVFRPDNTGVDVYDLYALFNYDGRYIYSLPHDGAMRNIDQSDGKLRINDEIIFSDNRLLGASLLLDGNIGVAFHAALDDSAVKVVLNGPDGEKTFTDLADYQVTDPETGEVSYKFVYYVNATQAESDITMQVFWGNASSKRMDIANTSGDYFEDFTAHYTMKDYFSSYSYVGEAADELVAALDNYTKAASNFFNGTDNTISGISAVDIAELEQFKPDFTDEDTVDGDQSSNIKLSLILNSATTLRLYWDFIDGGDEAKLFDVDAFEDLDNLTAVYDSKSGKTWFEITNIPASKLTEQYRLTYGCDLYLNPMSYVYRVLLAEKNGNEIATPQLVELAKALYVYAKAAYNYQ